MATSRTAACILLTLATSACRTDTCPEVAPPAPPAAPVAALPVEPSCPLLSETDAQARANEWLAARTSSPAVPQELTASPCTSHCQRHGPGDPRTTPCDTWSCPYKYGGRYYLSTVTFKVYVAACGANIFTVRPYARCFARPHRCGFVVHYDEARAIATRTLGEVGPESVRLRWDPDLGEFLWVVITDELDERMEDYEVLRISAHVAGQISRVDPPLLHRPSW